MKRILALALAALMLLAFVGCSGEKEDIFVKSEGVMTYEQYAAAAVDADVVIEAFIQARTAYASDYSNASFYLADKDGGYYAYRVPCTADEYAKMTVGTKVKMEGKKGEWKGEAEIAEGTAKVTVLSGSYIAPVVDATAKLGTDDLIKLQNQFVAFKGMTVAPIKDATGAEAAFLYNWDGSGEKGNDLYFNVTLGENTYNFTVESDLCGQDTDVYKAVEAFKVGDKIDLEGFLYWYDSANPWITSVKTAA